jgi:hypothetical protein
MDNPKTDEKLWGRPLWALFHTLSIKIKPESFPVIRVELLQIILTICKNIFCPYCANHAVEYLEQNRFIFVNSVEEFKNFLFHFHNDVNIKTKKPLFLFDDLQATYEKLDTRIIIGNVLKPYEYFHKNLDFEFIEELRVWFDRNIDHFYE